MSTLIPSELQPGARATRALPQAAAARALDTEARTVELAFSSEEPYERWWGVEVLDHSPTSIRLGRMQAGGAVLMDHDTRDQVGVVESVRIDADRVARATVRFGRSVRASEVFQDVIDGIRRNVSVGYMVHTATLVEKRDGVDTYRITDWEPYEVSLVSVPADPTVGVGRTATPAAASPNPPKIEIKESTVDGNTPNTPNGADVERRRTAEILGIADAYARYDLGELARHAITSGQSVDEFRSAAMAKMSAAPKPTAAIGMSDGEVQRYSLMRLLTAMSDPSNAAAQRAAAFEFECGAAAATKAAAEGRQTKGTVVPWDVLTRDLTVGTATAGGHTVATDLLAASFIDLLTDAMLLPGMGATMFDGLVGNIAIPRQTAGASWYWVAESGAGTESQAAFDQVTMSPKTITTFTDISRRLLKQSSLSVEAFVRRDLARTLGLGIQSAAINGSGSSNQPRGILNTSGIGDVAGGTNGLAPAWSHIVDLETDVAVANAAVGTLQYLTNAKVRGALKKTSRVSGQNGFIWDTDNRLNGYGAQVTNAVPSNLTKGSADSVCSAIIFGNFADLLIAMWGGLDILVDPYTGGTAGTVRVIVHQDVDVAVRHPESFSAMKDALTA